MKVDIANLAIDDHIPVSFSKEFVIPSEYNLTIDHVLVNIKGNVIHEADFYTLEAVCDTVLYFNCDNCLVPVTINLDFTANERFSNEGLDEDCDVWQFIGKTFDLSPAIETNLLLSIPMKVVCSEDCKGLCFKCGHNLNESDCHCDKTYRDPRFEGLYSLFNEEEV